MNVKNKCNSVSLIQSAVTTNKPYSETKRIVVLNVVSVRDAGTFQFA